MIKSLSLVASIVSGMGAGIMSAPIQQLDGTSTTTTQTQQPYSLNVIPTYKTSTYSWRYTGNLDYNGQQDTTGYYMQYGVEKFSSSTRTNQGEIKASVYQNTNIIETNFDNNDFSPNWTFWLNTGGQNINFTWLYNNTLSVLTINPYDEWTSSSLDLTFRTTIQYKIPTDFIDPNSDPYNVYIEYYTQYAITTDDRFAKYSDAYITNEQNNYNWWQDVITNANDLYIPSAEYNNAWIANVNNGIADYKTNNVNFTKNIPINSNKNNYLFMFTARKIRCIDQNGIELPGKGSPRELEIDHEGIQVNDILSWLPEKDYSFTMSGNFIPGTHIEVIDLPSIMFQVLGMPFTFITTAFSLTLFPGTPYAIDIGNIFLGFLGIAFIIFIVSMILKIWGKK